MPNSLEDITSKEFLDLALKNAKRWCTYSSRRHLLMLGHPDYNQFQYIITNEDAFSSMHIDPHIPTIKVSTEFLLREQEREKLAEQKREKRWAQTIDKRIKVMGGVEIDPESMFVHEMIEYIINTNDEFTVMFLEKGLIPHDIAYLIENVNRTERSLKPFPLSEYFFEDMTREQKL